MPLEYAPRTRSIYSDLGFILLGFLAADRGGAPLSELFDRIMVRLKPDTTEDLGDPVVSAQADLLTFDPSPAERSGRADAADGRGRAARTRSDRRGPRQLRGGARRRRGPCGAVRHGVRRRRLCAHASCGAARGDATLPPPFSPRPRAQVHDEEHRARQLARARLGYDAADFVVRHADVGRGVRPRRLHRHVALDRPGYAIGISCCSPTASCGGGTLDEMRTVRRAFHDALGDV